MSPNFIAYSNHLFQRVKAEFQRELDYESRHDVEAVETAARRVIHTAVGDVVCAHPPEVKCATLWATMPWRHRLLSVAMRYVFCKTAAVLRLVHNTWASAQPELTDDYGEPIEALRLPPWLEPHPRQVIVVDYYFTSPVPAESVVLTLTRVPEASDDL